MVVHSSEGFYAFLTRRLLEQPICSPLLWPSNCGPFESNDALMNQSDPSLNNWEMADEFESLLRSYIAPMNWDNPLQAYSEIQNENIEVSYTSGGLTNSQTNQHHVNRVETSEASYRTQSGGGTLKLTPDQIREKKKQRDYEYRQKKKKAEAKLIAENKRLQKEMEKLIAEKQELEGQLLGRDGQFPGEAELIAENKRLQEENVKLTAEKKELIGKLMTRDGQLPAQAPQRQGQDTYIAQSTSEQLNRPSEEQVSDSEIVDFQNLHQNVPINAVATNDDVSENQKNSRTGTCYDNTTIKLLMEKIDEDAQSKARLSDFMSLSGEHKKIGEYNFPLSLHPVVDRITDVYGEVSATSKMNLDVVEITYILFCASVKEMGELQLEEVTEKIILKWGDTIKDALRINFKVDFAMDHLKKIAHAYIGQIESEELKNMAESISKLEADLNTRKEEIAKRKERSKKYMDAAEEFNGKSLGLFT